MRSLVTFVAVWLVGVVLAIGSQVAAVPAGAAFLLGVGYLMLVSLVLNSCGRARS